MADGRDTPHTDVHPSEIPTSRVNTDDFVSNSFSLGQSAQPSPPELSQQRLRPG